MAGFVLNIDFGNAQPDLDLLQNLGCDRVENSSHPNWRLLHFADDDSQGFTAIAGTCRQIKSLYPSFVLQEAWVV